MLFRSASGAPAATGRITVKVGGAGGSPTAIGGSNGAGSSVIVTNHGSLQTLGAQAAGIEAQSIGDGGGIGAANVFGTGALGAGASAATYDLRLSVGGAGGGFGNVGGAVSVTHDTGMIATLGDDSPGVLAQSIGGGGGIAGPAGSIATNAPDCASSTASCTAQEVGLSVAEIGRAHV